MGEGPRRTASLRGQRDTVTQSASIRVTPVNGAARTVYPPGPLSHASRPGDPPTVAITAELTPAPDKHLATRGNRATAKTHTPLAPKGPVVVATIYEDQRYPPRTTG